MSARHHVTFAHLEAMAYNGGLHLDLDREENIATGVVYGCEYWAVIPPAVEGGAA